MYVFGKNVVKELLSNNTKINSCFLADNFNDNEIIGLLNKKNIKVTYYKKRDLDLKVDGVHQGIIASIDDYQYYELDDIKDENLVVILDHLEDPHNFGAIIRTCESAGVKSIIIPKNRNVEINGTVMKTSAGALDNIKVVMVPNLVQALKELKKDGFWIVGTDMDGTDYTKQDYDMKTALIIGSEGFGISRLVKEECDFVVSIPMKGKINSLNASVAAGVIIYRVVTSRGL